MLGFLSNRSVRVKLGAVILLLILLLVGVLIGLVSTSQRFTGDAQTIKSIGDMRAATTHMELLARQVTAVQLENDDIIHAIEDSLSNVGAYTQTIVKLLTSVSNVSNDQFIRFLTDINSRTSPDELMPEIQSVAFVNRVVASARSSFESSTALQGFPNYQIYELDMAQQPVPAQQRSEYFPVKYVVPVEPNRAMPGFDQASDPVRFAALTEAAETGKPVLTAPISTNDGNASTFLLFTPVYSTYVVPETVEARQASLQGFVAVSLDIRPIIQNAMARMGDNSMLVQVEDVTYAGAPIRAYYNHRNAGTSQRTLLNVDVLGRKWQVTASPPIDIAATLHEIDSTMQALDRNIDALEPTIKYGRGILSGLESSDFQRAYTDLKIARLTLKHDINRFVTAQETFTFADTLPSIQKEGKVIYDNLGMILGFIQTIVQEQADRNVQAALVTGGLGVAAALAGSAVVYSILRRLSQVKRNAQKLADGDLTARNQMRSKDEIGQIGNVLNVMAEGLQASFKSVSDSEARYRILAENVADLIAVSDADGNLQYVSPACRTMLGYEPEALIGTHPNSYIHPEDLAAEVAPGMDNHEMVVVEHRLRRKDGDYIWAETARQMLSNSDGGARQYISVTRDITERKAARLEHERLQQQIIEAQKQAIRDLSSPVIPVTGHIIIMPLVGSIDTARAHDITRALLAGVSDYHAQIAILDVTGVPIVDSGVADHLNRTIQAARLKGAHTIISGISPEIAETIVDLGIDWSGIQTVRDLQSGLQLAMETTQQIRNVRPFSHNGKNGHKHEQGA